MDVICCNCLIADFDSHSDMYSGNFSIRFWRQYVSLFASIASVVSLLLTSDRKSSHRQLVANILVKCHGDIRFFIHAQPFFHQIIFCQIFLHETIFIKLFVKRFFVILIFVLFGITIFRHVLEVSYQTRYNSFNLCINTKFSQ